MHRVGKSLYTCFYRELAITWVSGYPQPRHTMIKKRTDQQSPPPPCAFPATGLSHRPRHTLLLASTPHPDQSSALSPHPCSSSRREIALLPTSTPHPLPSHIHHAHIKARQLRKRRGREIEVSFLTPRTTIFDPDDHGLSLVWRAERSERDERSEGGEQGNHMIRLGERFRGWRGGDSHETLAY